jgi:hypothetical protein
LILRVFSTFSDVVLSILRDTSRLWDGADEVFGASCGGMRSEELLMEIVGHCHLDAIEKPVDATAPPVRRRSHKATRPQLLTRATLDGRTSAARFFDRLVVDIESDLAGHDQLSAIEHQLVEAFAGAAVTLAHLNTKLALGEDIDIGQHAACVGAMVRVASRLGLARRSKTISPRLSDMLRRPQP